jgi:hypothetical protein
MCVLALRTLLFIGLSTGSIVPYKGLSPKPHFGEASLQGQSLLEVKGDHWKMGADLTPDCPLFTPLSPTLHLTLHLSERVLLVLNSLG